MSTADGFPIEQIPFSYSGSWFNLSRVIGNARYARDVHLVSHQTGLHPVLRFAVTRAGDPDIDADAVVTATPSVLTWRAGGGVVRAAYQDHSTLRLRGSGAGFVVMAAESTLTPTSGTYFYRDPRDGAFVFTVYETGRRYRLTVLCGTPERIHGLEELAEATRGVEFGADVDWEVALEEYETSRTPYAIAASFEDVVADAAATFSAFAESVAPFAGERFPAGRLAAYTMWSATVRPLGFVSRPAVLMSKHWMDKVWSWDQCFNALALAGADPDFAWDQFLTVFDHQDASGALPDSISHSEVLYNYVKPPIHGWAFKSLRRRMSRALTRDEVAVAYERLAFWTSFWLEHRRVPTDALPYYQHGNDSGWDNATTFAAHRVVQTSDLAAFLVLQLRTVADLTVELGKADDERRWRGEAERLEAALFGRLWDGGRFVARSPESGATWTSDSLLDLMPIVLGDRLPPDVTDQLVKRIGAHLGPAGLATERVDSDLYESDGYWRGPVWAPATVLIEDGLRRAGQVELADEISAGFRALCERSGFAENFDAVTGAGLRDRAYTWTASAYLLLAAQASDRQLTP